mgnify:CR=1 FL=1
MISAHQTGRVRTSVVQRLPKPRRRVRLPYPAPSSRTKKDIYAKNPEVSTASGFFCAHFLKLEKKISKRVLAKSVDLNLYPRDFGPLFREFFGKAALFCPRQNVEFRPAFLLVMPNTHSKHRCQRVSQLCGILDVKTAGKPHPHSRTKTRRIGDAGTRESKAPAASSAGGRLSAGSQQSIGF